MSLFTRKKRVRYPEEERKRIEVPAYSQLAWIYDDVMDHVDYKGWAAHVHRIAKHHGRAVGTVIDFACGTGTLGRELVRHNYPFVGLDSSEGMIREAKRLYAHFADRMEFYVCPMTEKPPVRGAQLGVCLYDSVNYLMEEAEVDTFLAHVRGALREGGLFIVDLSTEQNSREHFDGYSVEEELEGAFYRRWTRFDPVGCVQHNYFDILPDDEPVVYHEHHQQRVYGVQWMSDRMEAAGMKVVGVYHNMTMRTGGESSDRVHIVAEPR